MTKKLQVALDMTSSDAAFQVLEMVGSYVDIIEIGTPLIAAEGMHIMRGIRSRYPAKFIFADTKIVDAGEVIANLVLEAGADMISVVACTEYNTIEAAITAAHRAGKYCLVDMVAERDIPRRAKELAPLKPDYMATHIGYDIRSQNIDPIDELHKLDGVSIPKAIAGGITLELFPAAVRSCADIIIVGEGLYNQPDPSKAARAMRNMILNGSC